MQLLLTLVFLFAAGIGSRAAAQEFPSRVIRVIAVSVPDSLYVFEIVQRAGQMRHAAVYFDPLFAKCINARLELIATHAQLPSHWGVEFIAVNRRRL